MRETSVVSRSTSRSNSTATSAERESIYEGKLVGDTITYATHDDGELHKIEGTATRKKA